MNSTPSRDGQQAPGTSRPENEDDDPVGDNKPVIDAGGGIPAEEPPEGSDARPSDRLNGHRAEEFPTNRPARQPSSDSKLPQSSRG
ncbi:MAG: hypothetical protein EOP37_25355 [Rubrivivax sp.]|jgi:hypothetical protein|nr:MAG: hypothetical protein EOP37_25355 [Rubrivivax sp.]